MSHHVVPAKSMQHAFGGWGSFGVACLTVSQSVGNFGIISITMKGALIDMGTSLGPLGFHYGSTVPWIPQAAP